MRFFISSFVSDVIPSTEFTIEVISFGFVTFRIIWVLHWDKTDFSILDGRWVIMHNPNPNFLPSAEICLIILEDFTSPKLLYGIKL